MLILYKQLWEKRLETYALGPFILTNIPRLLSEFRVSPVPFTQASIKTNLMYEKCDQLSKAIYGHTNISSTHDCSLCRSLPELKKNLARARLSYVGQHCSHCYQGLPGGKLCMLVKDYQKEKNNAETFQYL